MSRVVCMIDSSTGKLIDAYGNVREGARYKKFANRMLSTDENPVLNYGVNGGDSLTISKNGARGSQISLMADSVVVSGELSVGNKTMSEIAAEQSENILNSIVGNDGQTTVVVDYSDDGKKKVARVQLDGAVSSQLSRIQDALDEGVVLKSDIAYAISDISVQDGDTLEDVKGTLKTLLTRLGELVGMENEEE